MAWKYFTYACSACEHVEQQMVDDARPEPDPCSKCGSTALERVFGGLPKPILTYVPDYPGANYHRAGYTYLRRPAEKAGRQVTVPAGVPKR